MPYHIFSSTTLLLYKLDTLLLKQKNLPVLDITGFFFRIRTQVTALVLRTSAFTWVLMRKKKPWYPIRAASFVSIVLYPIHIYNEVVIWNIGVFCDIFEWKMANWVCCDCPSFLFFAKELQIKSYQLQALTFGWLMIV